MPKKSSHASVADEQPALVGAAAVDRAISLLKAFDAGDKSLTVPAPAQRTRLYTGTVLRLLASLAHGRLVQRTVIRRRTEGVGAALDGGVGRFPRTATAWML